MKIFILQFFLIFSLTAFGQKDSSSFPQALGLRLSYAYSDLQYIDIGVGLGNIIHTGEMIGPLGYQDAFINIGYGWTKNNSVMTTKLGYELMTVLPGARISLFNVTDFERNQIGILPEIGLSYNSIIYAMYGYNINLSSHDAFNAKGHQFNVGLNFPLYIFSDKKFVWEYRK